MNYNDIIEAALKEGADFEQIAAAFSTALNEKMKVTKEQEAKQDAREEYIALLLDNIDRWWHNSGEDNDLAAAADVATYSAADAHESWDADRLRKFNEDAKVQLEALVNLYEREDKRDPLALEIRHMMNIAKGTEECDCKCEKEKESSDVETLLRFLKDLGL